MGELELGEDEIVIGERCLWIKLIGGSTKKTRWTWGWSWTSRWWSEKWSDDDIGTKSD